MNIRYQGVFFGKQSTESLYRLLGQNFLDSKPEDPLHVTFLYRPSEDELFPAHLVGQNCLLRIVGIGNDGRNAGFEVAIPKEFAMYYKGAPKAHITMSLGQNAKPVATKDLDFTPCEHMYVAGQFGFFTSNGVSFRHPLGFPKRAG